MIDYENQKFGAPNLTALAQECVGVIVPCWHRVKAARWQLTVQILTAELTSKTGCPKTDKRRSVFPSQPHM